MVILILLLIVLITIIYAISQVKKPKSFDLTFEASDQQKGKWLVVDTETTGLITDRYADITELDKFPRIIQISWLLFDDKKKLIKEESMYVNPGVRIPAEATRINKITNKMIREKGILPEEALRKFIQDAENAEIIVAHNTEFDLPIIESELWRNGFGTPLKNIPYLCTMKTCKNVIAYTNKSKRGKYPKLSELAGWLFIGRTDIEILNGHDAYKDAALTAKCLFEMFRKQVVPEQHITTYKSKAKT